MVLVIITLYCYCIHLNFSTEGKVRGSALLRALEDAGVPFS